MLDAQRYSGRSKSRVSFPGILLALWAVSWCARASALELGSPDDLLSVDVHGFVTQGFILTTGNDYIDLNTTKGSFQYSEVGINFTKTLVDRLTLGIEFFGYDLGPSGNYDATVNWFYLDYHWRDWLAVRAGRVQIPYGFYNEIQDVDAARNPVLLPQSVYPLQSSTFLFAQTGFEVYGFHRFGGAGALDYRLFAGTIFLDPGALIPAGDPIQLQFTVPYVAGGRVIWETPLRGLRVAVSAETLHIDTTAFLPTAAVHIQGQDEVWLASVEYSIRDLTLTAELGRGYVQQSSDTPALSPYLSQVSEAGYVMATYRVARWFQPGVYYALSFPNVFQTNGRADQQNDFAATLRFDINRFWLVKLEGHFMAGTAGLISALDVDGPDVSANPPYWGAFFATTTAYF
ncbi:MAG TPA: hypothetical protein VMB50_11550 [Myxococcales bacterium]|nr:hypothetical protein [Myxococcales bacterium]